MTSQHGLKRGLSARHIRFMALGSAIGTGLFYGSASAIQMAGPAVLLAYLIGGAAVFMVMRALGEMAVHNPTAGSFSEYASTYLGPMAGFVLGWTYAFEMIIVCLADVTAFGIYMGFWFPDVPRWIWVLSIVFLIGALNLCNVKVFGETEFWLSLLKVGAIVAMIVAGFGLLLFGVNLSGAETLPSVSNLWAHGGFMPNGIGGLIACFAVVMFAFGGIEIIGITAGEAQDPQRTIPRAINAVPLRILLFYVLTLFVLMSLFPWSQITKENSPFVQIFSSLGIPWAAALLNIVVISAAVSAINSDIFGAGRMMYGLSQQGQAPKSFSLLSKQGVPWMTVVVMGVALLGGVLLNYLIPENVFLLIASLATFATVWVWLMILLTQVAMRRAMSREEVAQLKFPVPFWPVAPAAAIVFMLFIFGVLGYFPDNRAALIVGAVWVMLLVVAYNAWIKPGIPTHKNTNRQPRRPPMKTLWKHCHVASMAQGKYSIIEDAAIVTSGARIEWIGPQTQLIESNYDSVVDLNGAWVTPGLIDCHTHTVFGGNRSGEFEQRLQGVSYAEIAAAGGGIASTVRATRAASEDELYASAENRLRHLLKDGVTTVEMKSGYGLDLANERKLLRVIRRLGNTLPITVRSTCLAAHALPPEYTDRADDYINHICSEMLPALANEGLVDAVDAFCEYLAFSPAQVEQVFITAGQLGLPVKLHAEQLSSLAGSSLAARYHALSADHLEFMTEADAIAMGAAGTVAVLLPGAYYFLRETQLPPMDALRKHGVDIAIATDLNPGTSPALSLRLMLNMACTLFRMTPEEALAGVTINAAKALGMGDTHGSLEVGKFADFVAWNIERPADLAYWLGGDLEKRIVRHGVESVI